MVAYRLIILSALSGFRVDRFGNLYNMQEENMKTGREMFDFCKRCYRIAFAETEEFWIKTFDTIADCFEADEEGLMAFTGIYNYKSILKHGDTCAYAVTNKRILVSERKLNKIKIIDELSIEGVKASYETTAMLGVVRLESPFKTISIGFKKNIAQTIMANVQEILNSRSKLAGYSRKDGID